MARVMTPDIYSDDDPPYPETAGVRVVVLETRSTSPVLSVSTNSYDTSGNWHSAGIFTADGITDPQTGEKIQDYVKQGSVYTFEFPSYHSTQDIYLKLSLKSGNGPMAPVVGSPSDTTDGATVNVATPGDIWEKDLSLYEPQYDWSSVAVSSHTIPDYDASFGINVSMAGGGSTIAWGAPGENGTGGYGAGAIYYANNSGSSWGAKQAISNSSYIANERQGSTTQLSYDGLILASAGACLQDSTSKLTIRVYVRDSTSEPFSLSKTIVKNFPYNTNSTGGKPRIKLSGDGGTIVLYMYGIIGNTSGDDPDAGIWIYKWNGSSWVEKNFESTYTAQNRRDERELKNPTKWGNSGNATIHDIDMISMTDINHNGDIIYSLVVDPEVTTGPRRFHIKGYKYDSELQEYDSTWMSYTTDQATSISCGKSGLDIAWSLYGEIKAKTATIGTNGVIDDTSMISLIPTEGAASSWDTNGSGTEIHSCVTIETDCNPDGDDLVRSIALSWRANSPGSQTQFYSATNVFEYSDSSTWSEKGIFEQGYDNALPFVQLSNNAKSLIYWRHDYDNIAKVLKRTESPYGWA